ncbi:MAG: RNA polymerase sigma factor [Chlorobiota bacterium]|nr:RNA polymerase sigma factor [Chlorobiota bacterium]QQS66223.1 MAG: RNA polymerase sigma factor [Chlorobiota bacterium]
MQSVELNIDKKREFELSEDKILFNKMLNGDNKASLQFFNRHNKKLVAYCSKIISDYDGAQDVVQDVWRRLLDMRRNSSDVDNPLGYIFTIARNLSLNFLRSKKRRLNNETTYSDITIKENMYKKEEYNEKEELINRALKKLPENYREILELSIYSDYSYKEIAEIKGSNENAICTKASRARERLREEVAKLIKY